MSRHPTSDINERIDERHAQPAHRLRPVRLAREPVADPRLLRQCVLDHALAKVQILTDLYGSVGLPKAVAAQRAELTYTAYMGHWRVKAMLPLAETGSTNSYIDHLIDTLIPS